MTVRTGYKGCQDLNSYIPSSVGRTVSIKNYYKNLGEHTKNKRLVYEYLRDYRKGLTVCEFLSKSGFINKEGSKLRFRPRFSDLTTEGKVTQNKRICGVCGRKETSYKLA